MCALTKYMSTKCLLIMSVDQVFVDHSFVDQIFVEQIFVDQIAYSFYTLYYHREPLTFLKQY
jgi:hypothetical protein